MAKVKSAYEKAKSRITRKGCTITELKGELRKQFKNRMKDMRRKLVDSHRQITPDDFEQGYQDFADSLQSEIDEFDQIDPDEVIRILKNIQAELMQEVLHHEANDHEKFFRSEIEAIIANYFTCKICEEASDRDICDSCSATMFDSSDSD